MDNLELEQLEKHIKNAWVAGAISGILTLIFSLVGAYNDTFRYQYGLDTWSLLDVALIAGLTYGIYKKNRFCALGLLVYFVLSKFITAASSGEFSGGFMSLLFAYFFFQGTRATFLIHKYNKENQEKDEQRSKRSLGYYIMLSFASLFILGFVALFVIGAYSPEIEVIPGKQINKKYLNYVFDAGLIDRSEVIQYWYSDAFGDFKDGFYFFTTKNVVVYSQLWEEPAIVIPFTDIGNIEFEQDLSFIDDSRITLLLRDGTSVNFPVSSENGGDLKFYNRLEEIWKSYPEIENTSDLVL